MSELISSYAGLIAALVACGLFSGFVAGLFGIGGGAVIVPVLILLFDALGYGESAAHVAIATSLATIILTSARSVWAHHQRGAVDWAVVSGWAPWIVVGAVLGQLATGALSGGALRGIFGGLALILAAQLFFGRPDWRLADDLPGGAGRAGLGGLIGSLSAIMGIGGGTFGVSLMTLCGRAMHQAVATAAGFGVMIGLPGAVTAIVVGWGRADLPPFSLGHVNLAAFALMSAFTVMTAPVGARLAHRLDARRLKKLFAILLAVVAIRLLLNAIGG
jgi:uncharacterized membrane protein YfcA